MGKLLEVCVDSFASAEAAVKGGADRLELCSALTMGGLTPYEMLLRQIKAKFDIPVRCLMRPRAGDFLYTKEELELLKDQIIQLKKAGADGFVIGCLDKDGHLDVDAMKPLVKACGDKGITLHRCIDVSANLEETYRAAAGLGIDTILTSGGAGSCLAGMENIRRLIELRDEMDGPEVLIGAGVKASVIGEFLEKVPGSQAFHMSGKTEIESGMVFRWEGVPMGAPGLDEWHIPVTSTDAIRQAKSVLQK